MIVAVLQSAIPGEAQKAGVKFSSNPFIIY
jgi:hypothetical protein